MDVNRLFNRYLNDDTNEERIKEQSDLVFKEVSSAIYYVEKDKLKQIHRYVSGSAVVSALNFENKVSIIGKNEIYTNFELDNYKQS